MTNDYVSVVYDDRRTPKTDYPAQLTGYLITRFGLRRGDKLLEIGCGRGGFLEAFSRQGLECYGVDRCTSAFDKLDTLHLSRVDLASERLPYGNAEFDVVYHKSVLEHFFSPDHIMKESLRVLKPGGRMIILVPDWISQMKVFYEDVTHCRPYDRSALADLFRMYGLLQTESELFHQLPVLWKHGWLKPVSALLRSVLSTPAARRLTAATGVKFFRWSVELMVLGTAIKSPVEQQ